MEPALIVGLVGAAVSLTVFLIGNRRAKKVDATSAQSGAASNHRAGIQQVIEGLNELLDQAQETIKDDREVKSLLDARIRDLVNEVATARAENALYRAKYGPIADLAEGDPSHV